MNSRHWDELYRTRARVFSGNPNEALVAEATGLPPGQALDVGCGEGADALWLARHGWHVTAVDVSETALRRGAATAAAADAAAAADTDAAAAAAATDAATDAAAAADTLDAMADAASAETRTDTAAREAGARGPAAAADAAVATAGAMAAAGVAVTVPAAATAAATEAGAPAAIASGTEPAAGAMGAVARATKAGAADAVAGAEVGADGPGEAAGTVAGVVGGVGRRVAWVWADLGGMVLPDRSFDLVSVQYFPLRRQPGDAVLRRLLNAVAPGGTLLFATHARADLVPSPKDGFDPAGYYQAEAIASLLESTVLESTWTVLVNETRPRVTPAPTGTRHSSDSVLRAQRLS
ncbi:methyltransferase domain-containing protein [Amycolatopsis sp. NBC_01480]|uniref:methyltransferase domain-containing protein n=1 Tax=Amycolatopsis sp. NBC_01480 TaxID=2903562 RepID=UPI002E2B14DC|nr:methyltransferase domain-containing protein [Amycolatopsis sp. NBC_01480]